MLKYCFSSAGVRIEGTNPLEIISATDNVIQQLLKNKYIIEFNVQDKKNFIKCKENQKNK